MLTRRGPGILFQTFFSLLCLGCIAAGAYLVQDHVQDVKVLVAKAKNPMVMVRNIIHR